jgi:hypothetical protein
MPNRRVFLQTGVVVSTIAMNGVIARSAGALGERPSVALGRAIYDDRYAEGRRFAAVIGAQSVATRALDEGDITRFWYEELDELWRREPVAVAGFTQYGPMFVVERLAAERGLRLALKVEHRVEPDGTLLHVIAGPSETVALAAQGAAAGADWPGLMAVLACRASAGSAQREIGTVVTAGPPPRLAAAVSTPMSPEPSIIHYYTPRAVEQGFGAPLEGPLYSWVAASRRRG